MKGEAALEAAGGAFVDYIGFGCFVGSRGECGVACSDRGLITGFDCFDTLALGVFDAGAGGFIALGARDRLAGAFCC